MSFVNRAVSPNFLAPSAPPALRPPAAFPGQVGPSMAPSYYQPSSGSNTVFLNSNAGSDPIANLKVLATNVWTTMSNMFKSIWTSLTNAFAKK